MDLFFKIIPYVPITKEEIIKWNEITLNHLSNKLVKSKMATFEYYQEETKEKLNEIKNYLKERNPFALDKIKNKWTKRKKQEEYYYALFPARYYSDIVNNRNFGKKDDRYYIMDGGYKVSQYYYKQKLNMEILERIKRV